MMFGRGALSVRSVRSVRILEIGKSVIVDLRRLDEIFRNRGAWGDFHTGEKLIQGIFCL
jgi:hypothetical protein